MKTPKHIAAALDEHAWDERVRIKCLGITPDDIPTEETRRQAIQVAEQGHMTGPELLLQNFTQIIENARLDFLRFKAHKKEKVKSLRASTVNRNLLIALDTWQKIHSLFPAHSRLSEIDRAWNDLLILFNGSVGEDAAHFNWFRKRVMDLDH